MRQVWIAAALAASAVASPPESRYVGSKICYGCHAEIYRSYLKTGMGRSMRPASDLDQAGLPVEATVPLPSATRVVRVFRDQTGWHQSESEANVFVDEQKLEYIVGSGSNGLTFLVRRGNYLFQAPLSYYSRTKKWGLSPGYEYRDDGFNRSILEECTFCHSGRAQPVPDRPGEYRDPPFSELAIGCENCHGPGETHTQHPDLASGIVNPAKLKPLLAENICMACHQGGDTRVLQPGKTFQDIRPGQWLINSLAIVKATAPNRGRREMDLLEHYAAMENSRCFRDSGGRLTCLTCHDPHVQPSALESPAYFRAKCLTCHTEQSCKLPFSTRQETRPADSCAGCHMPKRSLVVVSHAALTNHRIPARPSQTPPPSTPDGNDELVIVNQPDGQKVTLSDARLLRAYSELAIDFPDYQQRYVALLDRLAQANERDPFVQASLAHRALSEGKNEEALQYLTIGIQVGSAAAFEDKAKALANLGRTNEAVTVLTEGVGTFPYNQELRKTLILTYITSKCYAEARQHMANYVALFPEDDFMRKLLARAEK